MLRLSWTVFSRYDIENEERRITEEPMWATFGLLSNVRYLDFASLANHRERVPPPLLFPNVTHLRLSGQMSWALVRAFIDSLDPTRLISLECNNLQDFGQLCDGEDLDVLEEVLQLNRRVDLTTFPESKDIDDATGSEFRHPGAMRGHLQRLEGKCSNLQHLCLRSVGQDDPRDDRWSPSIDAARYEEWASFIHSVRPALHTLTIEQGLEVKDIDTSALCPRLSPLQIGRLMDDRLVKHILPTFSIGEWPRLKQLKILGVGSEPRYDISMFRPGAATVLYVKQTLAGIRALRDVKVEVREEATKTFFFRSMHGLTYAPG